MKMSSAPSGYSPADAIEYAEIAGTPRPASSGLRGQLRAVILGVISLSLLTGCVFPWGLFAPGRLLFPVQANTSLLTRAGVVVGSEWIGQNLTRPEYFQPRPSAAGTGYDGTGYDGTASGGTASGGTNLGPFNPKLIDDVRQLAKDYRERNRLQPDTAVPVDVVTRSGSGLDPDISAANAELQVARVARARGLGEKAVRSLVVIHTHSPQLAFPGGKRVSVLDLNLALDRIAPVVSEVPH
jgi:potassium-transporting ATPase KdpC subunit